MFYVLVSFVISTDFLHSYVMLRVNVLLTNCVSFSQSHHSGNILKLMVVVDFYFRVALLSMTHFYHHREVRRRQLKCNKRLVNATFIP